jgi:hypothetical protein
MMVVDLAIDEEIRKYEKEYGPNATHDKYPSVVINIFNKRHETITGYIKEAQRTLEQAIANPDSSNDEIARLQVEVNETTNLYDYIQRAYDAHMVHLQNIFTRCT